MQNFVLSLDNYSLQLDLMGSRELNKDHKNCPAVIIPSLMFCEWQDSLHKLVLQHEALLSKVHSSV